MLLLAEVTRLYIASCKSMTYLRDAKGPVALSPITLRNTKGWL